MFEAYSLIKPDIPPKELAGMLDINSQSAYYNLILSNDDVLKLVSARNVSLKYAERIEFGFETLETIINAFYKSPYINQFEYTDIISELQFIFYILKNEISEALTDDELISMMAELFNGPCAGSLELLKGRGAEYIIAFAKQSGKADEAEDPGYTPDDEKRDAALRSGIVPSYAGVDAERLANGLAAVLEELLLKYTKGRSLSIKAETAQSIINTIMYASRIAGERGTDAVELKAAYYKGIEIIGGLLEQAKRLYSDAEKTRIKAKLSSYNETFVNMSVFFECYDKEFAAAEIPARISYLPIFCDSRLDGVEFIISWLLCFIAENEICGLFDGGEIELLLVALEKKEQKGRALLEINLFELIATNCLYAILAGKAPGTLELIENDADSIKRRQNITDIEEAGNTFIQHFRISDETAGYFKRFISDRLMPRIEASRNKPELTAVFSDGRQSGFLYPNKKMPDEKFRELTHRLRDDIDFSEKVRIMNENVNSLYDLVDLFNAGIFHGGEYKRFFEQLSGDEAELLLNFANQAMRLYGRAYTDAPDSVTPESEWVKELFEYLKEV